MSAGFFDRSEKLGSGHGQLGQAHPFVINGESGQQKTPNDYPEALDFMVLIMVN